MIRHTVAPREDWLKQIETLGFAPRVFEDGLMDWQEGACYEFRPDEIDALVEAGNTLHQRYLDAVDHVVSYRLYARLGIPDDWGSLITASWHRQEAPLLGRFDLIYDGVHPPKLVEYNPDTPTALLEASLIQAMWKEDRAAHARQFNRLHPALLERFGWLAESITPEYHTRFLLPKGHEEVEETVNYLIRCAAEAGISSPRLYLESFGWDEAHQRFIDLEQPPGPPLDYLFKLYPWEWLLEEAWAPCFLDRPQETPVQVFEPVWKLLLANKAMLAILWELFPEHPNLLPASFEPGRLAGTSVEKPFYARQSHNVTIQHPDGGMIRNPGAYDRQPAIYQAFHQPPAFQSETGTVYPLIHGWMVGHEMAGIGIIEDRSLITTHQTSRFIPHFY